MYLKNIKTLPKQHKLALYSTITLLLMVMLWPSSDAPVAESAVETSLELGKRYSIAVNIDDQVVGSIEKTGNESQWKTITVGKGDTLAKIFAKSGLSPQETYHVSKAGKHANKLKKIMPGQQVSLNIDAQGKLQTLRYQLSAIDTLIINKKGSKNFDSSLESKTVNSRVNFAQGDIRSSFWQAAVAANLDENLIMNLAGIFGWDIDFALEIRKDDSFSVLFEEEYIDGELVGYGDILAAEFVNQGETYQAVRHTDGNYYTPEGRSMRKSFLRAPVNFKYISSSFKKRRFHPVQKRWKAHRGVDYAANRGTPVMAAGKGKVIRAGYDKYNGHHVFIQHGEKYVTKYLHFTKRKVKRGQSVKQGQIIGTVGSTGLAAGPHLHYEFLVNGVHRNPRTVKLPKAEPINKKEKAAFQRLVAQRLQQMDSNKRIMLAMN